MIKVKAIYVDNKPDSIPDEYWLEKDKMYTVVDASAKGHTIILVLEEIDLEAGQFIYPENGRIWKGFKKK